jgi:hypothetical protein
VNDESIQNEVFHYRPKKKKKKYWPSKEEMKSQTEQEDSLCPAVKMLNMLI